MHLPNRPSPDQLLTDQIQASLGLAGRVRTGETHAVLSFGTLFSCQGATHSSRDEQTQCPPCSFERVPGRHHGPGVLSTPDHHFGNDSPPTRGSGG